VSGHQQMRSIEDVFPAGRMSVSWSERSRKRAMRGSPGTTDPRHAMALFLELQPDLLMLDLRMPHLDGFEVMESLFEQIPDAAEVSILILTADDKPDMKRRALAAGARDFLTKPLDLAEVLARVENLLEIRLLLLRLAAQDEALKLLRELAESSPPITRSDA
jgi:DNA-binding response OmpR family regulator